jgi:ribosomal protein S21
LRGLPLAPAANPKYHNAKVDAGDEDVGGEDLLRRFNWQVSRAGVMEEIRRRRRHETPVTSVSARRGRRRGGTTGGASPSPTALSIALLISELDGYAFALCAYSCLDSCSVFLVFEFEVL